ncbi:unnamed protein product [[Candida] boidinii]|nr:unnamed protein product [[Candida] boidinii]
MNPPDIDKTDIKRRKIDNTQVLKPEKSQKLPLEQSEKSIQYQTEKPQQQQLLHQQQNNSQIPGSQYTSSNSKFTVPGTIGNSGNSNNNNNKNIINNNNGIIGNGNTRHKSKRKEKQNKYTYYPVSGSYYLPPIQVYYFPHSSAHAEEKLTYSKSRNGSVGDEKGSKYFTSPTTPSYEGLGPTYKYFLKNGK